MAIDLVDATDATEPLTLDQVKAQVKLPTGDATYVENDLIEAILIPAVRQRCETATRRQIREVTYDWTLSRFPCEWFIEFPWPPLIEVEHVKHLDTAGDLQTLVEGTDYIVSAPRGEKPSRGRIALAADVVWPVTLAQINAVQIRFRCGYSDDEDLPVPALLKAAMLLDAGTLYADRENLVKGVSVAELPGGRRGIYWSWRSHPTQVLEGVSG
jgi:uncharacterized phiE125 gp8 family phage protein